MLPFSCPRTCPWFEPRDECRFNPVLLALGRTGATSHTTTIKVEYREPEALGRAAVAMGGQVLGQGQHGLHSSVESGYAIHLPGWRYPVILRADGRLAMDHYGGRWGNQEDLKRLDVLYAIEVAAAAATSQGWYHERMADTLVIYHPDGGTLTVTGGTVDAAGFTGQGCHDAALAIEQALGREVARELKTEYFCERAHVRATEGG